MVTPATLLLPVGGFGQLAGDARDAAGASLSGVSVNWASQNAAVASVSGTGMVTGFAAGQTLVIATAGGKADTADVTVIAAFALDVSPPDVTASVGQTAQFTATARDGSGRLIPLPPITWISTTPAVATVSTGGLATAVAAGTTGIIARSGTVASGPAVLTVVDPNPTGPCDGIEHVPTFDVNFSLSWNDAATVGNHRLEAAHSADIITVLTHPGDHPIWDAPMTGTGMIKDRDVSLSSQDTVRIDAAGPLMTIDRPRMTFEVDLATCRYAFRLVPWLNAAFTDRSGTTQGTSATGHLFTGWHDLPAGWRALGIPGFNESVPAHSFVWLLAPGNALLPSYLPAAFGALMWGSTAGAGETPGANADLSWAVTIRR
ncbi:MAG: Ig-like domain-containing protein [Gemmatimonadales bacterium]